MNARGIGAMVLGVWVISQVLLGDALDRLGVFGKQQKSGKQSNGPRPGDKLWGGLVVPGAPSPAQPTPTPHLTPQAAS